MRNLNKRYWNRKLYKSKTLQWMHESAEELYLKGYWTKEEIQWADDTCLVFQKGVISNYRNNGKRND